MENLQNRSFRVLCSFSFAALVIFLCTRLECDLFLTLNYWLFYCCIFARLSVHNLV